MISCFEIIKMNKIVNRFLLAEDKFMPGMHLKQHRFTYSACGPFTKKKERIQKIKETGDSKCTYRNDLDKACFQHDVAYGNFEDLARTIASDKVLILAFNITKNPEYDGCQRGLASMVVKFFDKISAVSGIKQNEQLAEELNQLLEKLKNIKCIHCFKTIFGMLILQICN